MFIVLQRLHYTDLRGEGMTVFITTHYLEEADALCDRISIMDHGEIVASGTPASLKRELSGDVSTLSAGHKKDNNYQPVKQQEKAQVKA